MPKGGSKMNDYQNNDFHEISDKDVHKEITNLMIQYAIFREDILRYPYKVKKTAYANYERLLEILSKLQTEGKCTFKAADLSKAYDYHCIYITWIDTQDNCFIELSASQIAEIISLADSFSICVEKDVNVWQLGIEIYCK